MLGGLRKVGFSQEGRLPAFECAWFCGVDQFNAKYHFFGVPARATLTRERAHRPGSPFPPTVPCRAEPP